MERKDLKETALRMPSVRSNALDADNLLYRSLVESLSEHAIFAISPTGDIITWNTGAENTYGYSKRDIIGKSFKMTFSAEDLAAGVPENELHEAHEGRRATYERWNVRKDGTRFWAANNMAPIYGAGNALIGFTKFVADMTESYRAREALQDSEERLRILIESVPEYAIFSLALDGSITSWNSAAHRALGYADHEIIGKQFAALFAPEDISNGVPEIVLQKATILGKVDEERWFLRKDGTRFLGSEKICRLRAGKKRSSQGFVHVAHDITAHKEFADDLRRRAAIDPLTGLANRTTFFDHVERAIALVKRRSAHLFAVMFIDLDHFKEINDAFGHMVADRLLEITARRLESCARTEDIVARIGGDEFAILLNGIHDATDAEEAASRIGAEMRKPIFVDTQSVYATVSVGIAMGTPQYDSPETILRDADSAMFVAKAGGRARSMVFTGSIDGINRFGLDLQGDLRHAIERAELRVVYQSIVRLADSTISGFEALVRWEHPRRGLLYPADFILRAEATDIIIAVDRWVLATACSALAGWRAQLANRSLCVSVNLSSKQFTHPDLISHLHATLQAAHLTPDSVHLEITESAIMEKSCKTEKMLAAVSDAGFELHVDDFGVGYSSLSVLRDLPVKALKIDQSFITKMDTRNGIELVRTIIQLAHNLGLVAIAEGIENVDQLSTLVAMSCDYGQGFFLSEPCDAESVERMLAARAALVS
jgi:diguanylate cyclase (GGDEF)-like protein/PAS domain S-box-containing protein